MWADRASGFTLDVDLLSHFADNVDLQVQRVQRKSAAFDEERNQGGQVGLAK